MRQMHGLSSADCQVLARLRVLFVGDRTSASDIWLSLLQHYEATVTEYRTGAECLGFLHANTAPRNAPQTLLLTPSFIDTLSPASQQSVLPLSVAFLGVADLLLLDLDSKESSFEEDGLLEALMPFAPLRVLCLYSKAHMAHASEALLKLGMGQDISGTLSGGVSPLRDVSSELDLPTCPSDIAVPAVMALAVETSLRIKLDKLDQQPTKAKEFPMHATAAAANAPVISPPQDDLSLGVSGTAVRPPLSTIELPAYAWTGPGNSALLGLPLTDGGGGVAVRMLRRSLRKPFKLRSLLRALLSVANDPLPMQLLATLLPSPDPTPSVSPSVNELGDALDGSLPGVTLPLAVVASHQLSRMSPAVPSASSAAAAPPSRGKLVRINGTYPLRILLAEDNLINQKMMVMLLRRLGYQIAVAPNGLEALRLLEREANRGADKEIQCIIMDACMGEQPAGCATHVFVPSRSSPGRC